MTKQIRWHEPKDENKLNDLVNSMRENGWQGAPLVCWGEQLYTGAHRSAAAEIAGIEYPTINLQDIFTEAGMDFEEAHWLYDQPAADDAEMAMVIGQLPTEIKDKYGIDID